MTTKQLTDRDREILHVLTHRVRVLTLSQIARTWYADAANPARAALRRVRDLSAAGLVERLTVVSHPELMLAAPVFRWTPGDTEPDFGPISYRLRCRWTKPARGTTIVTATRAANHRLGGYIGDRRPRRSETTHDVHLSLVYLWFRQYRPALAKRWISEHEQYASGGGRNERLPDAIIRDRKGDSRLVVEFAGSYSKSKLIEFHEAVSSTPYQLW